MLPVSEKQWTLSLPLTPGYYYYRYRLDRDHWRLDPFSKETVVIPEGAVQGKFTLLRLMPKDYKGHIDMSVRFIERGRLDWASEVLLTTAKTYPNKIEAYVILGEVYEKLGYLGFAVDAYLAALEKKGNAHDIRYNLANVYEALYEEQKKDDYRKRARKEWLILLEAGKYKDEAKEYLAE
jgi:tetratricopeptide (TPR) repeat protein